MKQYILVVLVNNDVGAAYLVGEETKAKISSIRDIVQNKVPKRDEYGKERSIRLQIVQVDDPKATANTHWESLANEIVELYS